MKHVTNRGSITLLLIVLVFHSPIPTPRFHQAAFTTTIWSPEEIVAVLVNTHVSTGYTMAPIGILAKFKRSYGSVA